MDSRARNQPERGICFEYRSLLQVELLRGEGIAWRNNDHHVLAIKIRPHDGAIIPTRIAHVGPVDVPGDDIERQTVGQLPAFVDDGLQI